MKARKMALIFTAAFLLTLTNDKAVFASVFAAKSENVVVEAKTTEDSGGSAEVVSKKNIPEEYREFVRKGSKYYHSLSIGTNYEVDLWKIVKKTKTPTNGTPFEAYYVYVGDYTFKLVTPEGEILTAEELDEYFLGILPPKTSYEPMEWENELLRLVNIEREKAGVTPLEANEKLMEIAALKAEEMKTLKYASHTSPVYGSPTEFARHYGFKKGVAENIMGGFVKDISPQAVLDNWMKSEGHKNNILNPTYKYMGTGWSSKLHTSADGRFSSTEYWFVQLFSIKQ